MVASYTGVEWGGCDEEMLIMMMMTVVVLTHSSCSDFSMAGILVAVGGLGLISGLAVNDEC